MQIQQGQFDKFNYYVGEIFAVLLDTFPRRTKLDMVKLIGAEACDRTYDKGRWTGIYKRNGEYEDVREDLDVVYETAHWLTENGFLNGQVSNTQIGKCAFVTLSPKTLEVFKMMPEAVTASGATLGQEIAAAAKSAAKAKLAEFAGKALTYGVRVGWEALIKPTL